MLHWRTTVLWFISVIHVSVSSTTKPISDQSISDLHENDTRNPDESIKLPKDDAEQQDPHFVRPLLGKIISEETDFKALRLSKNIYVDKSLLIKEFIDTPGTMIRIIRPPGWGKTLNLNMLKTFFDVEVDKNGKRAYIEDKQNHKFFIGGKVKLPYYAGDMKYLKPLKIADHQDIIDRYQGKIPIIYFDAGKIKVGNSFEETEESLAKEIQKLFRQYHYLSDTTGRVEDEVETRKQTFTIYMTGQFNTVEMMDGIRFLSEMLYLRYLTRVYVFFDNYDKFFSKGFAAYDRDRYMDFHLTEGIMGLFYKRTIVENFYVERIVLSGVLPLTGMILDNLTTECTVFQNRFSDFYGLDKNDIQYIVNEAQIPEYNKTIFRDWYGGLVYGNISVIKFNSRSAIKCLTYTCRATNFMNYQHLLEILDDKSQKVDLVDLRRYLFNNTDDKVLHYFGISKLIGFPANQYGHLNAADSRSFLLYNGLLSALPDPKNKSIELYDLAIPNLETLMIMQKFRWITRPFDQPRSKGNCKVNETTT